MDRKKRAGVNSGVNNSKLAAKGDRPESTNHWRKPTSRTTGENCRSIRKAIESLIGVADCGNHDCQIETAGLRGLPMKTIIGIAIVAYVAIWMNTARAECICQCVNDTCSPFAKAPLICRLFALQQSVRLWLLQFLLSTPQLFHRLAPANAIKPAFATPSAIVAGSKSADKRCRQS